MGTPDKTLGLSNIFHLICTEKLGVILTLMNVTIIINTKWPVPLSNELLFDKYIIYHELLNACIY